MKNIDPSRYPRLSDANTRRAVYFWCLKLNTADIAKALDVPEAAVANSLADEREKRRKAAA